MKKVKECLSQFRLRQREILENFHNLSYDDVLESIEFLKTQKILIDRLFAIEDSLSKLNQELCYINSLN